MTTIYNIPYLNVLTMNDLYNIAKKYSCFNCSEIDRSLNLSRGRAYAVLTNDSVESVYVEPIKKYLIDFILRAQAYENIEVKKLYEGASTCQHLTYTKIASVLNCSSESISKMINGKSKSYKILELKQYLDTIIQKEIRKYDISKEERLSRFLYGHEDNLKELLKEAREYQDLSISKISDDLDMAVSSIYDYLNGKKKGLRTDKIKDYLENIICSQKRIVKVAQTAQIPEEQNENQFYDASENNLLKNKIESFMENHNLSLETALKLLQISEDDYKSMIERTNEIPNISADKIYKAISVFDESNLLEKVPNSITTNTKDTFRTSMTIASEKALTFINEGFNKFAYFLSKNTNENKNSNYENKKD